MGNSCLRDDMLDTRHESLDDRKEKRKKKSQKNEKYVEGLNPERNNMIATKRVRSERDEKKI